MIKRLFDSGWRFRQLLAVLVLVILVMPAVGEFSGTDTTAMALTTAAALTIIVAGVLFASGHRDCWVALGLSAIVLAMVWFCTLRPDADLRGYHDFGVAGLLFFSAYLAINYLRAKNQVDQETLAAAASIYLLFGLALGPFTRPCLCGSRRV